MKFAFALCLAIAALGAAPTRIAIVGGPQPLWPEIVAAYQQQNPTSEIEWVFRASESEAVDLLFAYYPTGAELDAASSFTVKQRLGFPSDFVAQAWKQAVDSDRSSRAAAYLDEGGLENGVRLLAYLRSLVGSEKTAVLPPLPGPRVGIHHPDAPQVFAHIAEYQRWWNSTHNFKNPSMIAIPFFSTWLRSRDTAAVDAMIHEIEQRGSMPVAAFGYPLESLTPVLSLDGLFVPQVVIAMNVTLTSPKDADVYTLWGVPAINAIVTRESASEWSANVKGLPPDRIATQLGLPERSGLIAPTLVATTETSSNSVKTTQPYAPGIAAIVDRLQRMLALQSKPNAAKRIALLYYNNPAGKGNIGASYLQVFPSIAKILGAMRAESYAIANAPSEADLRRMLEASGRNVEAASEEPQGRQWPVAEYRRYYDALPASFRQQVEATWGLPESDTLMTRTCASARCFVLPVVDLGGVLLAPQPLRTTFDQASDPGHERVTPPPHQYVAFYLWLRHVWQADAAIHLGRHGTLEWLPGKQTALAPEDAPAMLLGDLPNFNVYVMDGGGEAIQAKRRGAATLVSHLTPMLWRTGGRAELETLHQAFHELMDRGDTLSPALFAEYEKVTRAEVRRLGLDRQLQLDMRGSVQAMAPALHRFLHEIEDAPLPAGLPVFGESPSEERLREAVSAFLFAAFPSSMSDTIEPHVRAWSATFLRGEMVIDPLLGDRANDLPTWIRAMRDSGHDELHGLLAALAGKHLPSRLLGDPLRKPEALPVGLNLHAIDSARIPTEAAWRVGQQMADNFLKDFQATHHTAAKRVSLVLWYGETERHQGAMESMAMALLGVRPVWNARGNVESLELIPTKDLGRERVDVVFTTSGNYRDGFADKLLLLDRAVRLAATAADSPIAHNDRKAAQALEAAGFSKIEAARQGRMRIFSSKPGSYGVGVQYLVERSHGVDSAAKIAALYTANMGHGYSTEAWGVPSPAAFKAQLRNVEAVQFSRSSNLYAALDNDDTYQYVGALRTAVEVVSGRAPAILVHNLRNEKEAPTMGPLREWLAVELHSRQLNPTWIAEMRASGYAGAREMTKEIEHLYGVQKTAPDHLDRRTWQTVMDVYVKDKYGLGLRAFFAQENPDARHALLERLLDVDRQGIHRFSAADRSMLQTEYAGGTGAAPMQSSATTSDADKSPNYRLEDLGQVGKYMITWVRPATLGSAVRSLPWWSWGALFGAYATSAAWRARANKATTLTLVRSLEGSSKWR
jgi:cobaltochelatase CobN